MKLSVEGIEGEIVSKIRLVGLGANDQKGNLH